MKQVMKRNFFLATVITVATFFLFFGDPDTVSPARSVDELWNLGHVGYFAIFTFLLNQSTHFLRYPVIKRWFVSLVVVLVTGVIIELLQYGTERSPDLEDLSRNLLGALLVLAYSPTISALLQPPWRRVSRIVIGAILLLHLLPLSIAVVDEAMAWKQFPVLANFDTSIELDRWKGGAQIERARLDGNQADLLKIRLSTAQYSGAGLQHFPADWSAYTFVVLRFYQPLAQPLGLTVRIHDELHNNQYDDRFNQHFELKEGWNELKIPLEEVKTDLKERQMDLTRVRDISFFSSSLPQPRDLYLDSIYLSI